MTLRDAAASLADLAAAGAREPRVVLLLLVGVGFALLSSVLHRTALRRRFTGDLAPMLVYFAAFFLLLFAAPLAWVLAAGGAAGLTPASLGLTAGDWRLGLVLCAIGTPIVVFAAFTGSRDPALRALYPFARDTLDGAASFALYEASYALLYYPALGVRLPRGAAVRPGRARGRGPAAVAAAILVQTMLSTVYHLGHPPRRS
ncbi:MAG: hypothetical protein MZW92_02395 [Comamonadaceae bacterium]|nr:hypothetical protein [Comamonadaceae bacterium]